MDYFLQNVQRHTKIILRHELCDVKWVKWLLKFDRLHESATASTSDDTAGLPASTAAQSSPWTSQDATSPASTYEPAYG